MTLRRFGLPSLCLIAAIALTAGCEVEFVGTAARESFAAFIINVLTTAVNETVGP